MLPLSRSAIEAVCEPHRMAATDVVDALDSDAEKGLTTAEVENRLRNVGPNELAEAPRTAPWRRFAAQFGNLLILILIGAAVIAFAVSGELKTPLVVLTVVVLNAVIGFVQENRAERALEALTKMLVIRARVRRNGEMLTVAAADLVPGDIVVFEAGDRVPADGRLLFANSLEIEEAALTGESLPATKQTGPIDLDGVALGDRLCLAFMNTTVTRGRAEMVITATGMGTEIGRLAGLLLSIESERTPLQKQLDGLAHSLAKLAGLIVTAVFVIGVARGHSLADVMVTAVALAVAAIPEGLPAVTVVTLALGVSKMAQRNAIVKRLASVETLGCTSVICSDKTGTLTLNEMTAVELLTQMRPHVVSGTGYAPDGGIEHLEGDEPVAIDAALMAMALCNDATIRPEGDTWQLVGDPTEGAFVALAAKGGIDIAGLRMRHPRVAELPFDSANKFMITVHEMVSDSGRRVVRLYVKGAPDVLVGRAATLIDENGAVAPVERHLTQLRAHNERMASQGLRVLAVGQRELAVEDWAEFASSGTDLIGLANDLTLTAHVGIVDPPRPEARQAIAEAQAAGLDVKMITGDHPATATSIGRQLGLTGESMTGAILDQIDDEELDRRLAGVSVFARVAPEHKLRLVTALQRQGNVVAMTGDGVNDAPALKRADIGIAMGITGSDVTKQAATMVLTDDNFATIVYAVRRGRAIYDNIVKFVRFQLSTTLGFAILFLLAGIFDIADGRPFTAIAILWVNIIMDGPPAMALGLDPAGANVMRRTPRPSTERILTRSRWVAVGISATVLAAGTLAVLAWTPGAAPSAGTATVAGTMAFNTFVLFQFFNLLNVRSETLTVFSRHTLRNHWLWLSLAAVVLLQVAVTHLGVLQGLFDTTSITLANWATCFVVASTVLWVDELRKLIIRTRENQR